MDFLKNLWNKVKAGYVAVRDFCARQILKGLMYGQALMDTVKFKKALGQETTFMDYVRVVGGFLTCVLVCAAFVLIVGFASFYVGVALSLFMNELLAAIIALVLRIAFVVSVVDSAKDMEMKVISSNIAHAVKDELLKSAVAGAAAPVAA